MQPRKRVAVSACMSMTSLRPHVVTALIAVALSTGCPGSDEGGDDAAADGTGTDGDGDADGTAGPGTDGGPGGPDADDGDTDGPGDDGGPPAGPHAMGTIMLGEAHAAEGGNATPIVSASFVPDAALVAKACTQEVAGCTISLAPDCGDSGCDVGEYCGFDDACQSTCLDICDADCGPGQVCYFPSPGNASCKAVETFDAGALTFGGTTTALTLFPPYTFNGEASGAPFAPGSTLSVDASGATAAGYEAFSREFEATSLLQTDLELLGIQQAYGDGPIPIGWTAGAESITVTAAVASIEGQVGTVVCEADDATGSFSFPREAIDAAIDGGALSGITLTVTRKRTELHTDLSTTGQLLDTTVQPEGWLELVTMSSESFTVEGCDFGEAVCGGDCIDVSFDHDNCGGCGNGCANSDVCNEAHCAGPTACFTCAEGVASCAAQNAACDANPDCAAARDCYQLCTDQACADACYTAHEPGFETLSELAACACSPCSDACGVFFGC